VSALAIIVAMTPQRVIGKDGGLPWSLPEDLRHFKATTMGHAVIMGRATHLSIGRPLPGRRNIVLSRRADASFAGCETAPSLDEALARAWASDPQPFVIGGAAVYAEALPRTTTIFLTRVLRDVEGDTYFPELAPDAWREVSARPGDGVVFQILERVR